MSEEQREIKRLRDHVIDELLTLKCPRADCRQPFVDFDGCVALQCSRCNAAFCGLCQEDCGRDGHQHVRDTHWEEVRNPVWCLIVLLRDPHRDGATPSGAADRRQLLHEQ